MDLKNFRISIKAWNQVEPMDNLVSIYVDDYFTFRYVEQLTLENLKIIYTTHQYLVLQGLSLINVETAYVKNLDFDHIEPKALKYGN